MATNVTNTTDVTALARIENFLRHNPETPQHVMEGFYHLKHLISLLEDAANQSTAKWQEAEDKLQQHKDAIDTLANELSFYVSVGKNGAGV